MGSSIPLFRIRGIMLRMHVTFPLILIWAMIQFGVLTGGGWPGAIFGLIVTILLFTVVVLHELGHSFAALYYGVPVKQIVLLPIGGVAQLESIPEEPVKEFVIAIAGPAVNIVLAVLLWIISGITGIGAGLATPNQLLGTQLTVDAVFNYVFAANLFLAIFNLIPAFPMDGGRILRAALASRMPYVRATNIAVNVGQAFAWLLGLWGFLGGGFFLILIAIFIYLGAGAEGRQVQYRSVLADLTVEQAYSRQAKTLPTSATLNDAVELTLSTFQRDFPVCDGEQLVGLLSYQKLVQAVRENGADAPVTGSMQANVPPVRLSDSIFEVQQKMGAGNLEALPVVDEAGRFLGLLTSRDVSEAYMLAENGVDIARPAPA